MKHILYMLSLLFVTSAFVGCKQNEIELYNQSSRVNFYARQRIVEFVDTDLKPIALLCAFKALTSKHHATSA